MLMGVPAMVWPWEKPHHAPPSSPPPMLPPPASSHHEYPTEDQTIIMLVGLAIAVVWGANQIYAHAEPHIWYDRQERWVLGLCFIAYLIAWVPVWLLPFDLQGMELRHSQRFRPYREWYRVAPAHPPRPVALATCLKNRPPAYLLWHPPRHKRMHEEA